MTLEHEKTTTLAVSQSIGDEVRMQADKCGMTILGYTNAMLGFALNNSRAQLMIEDLESNEDFSQIPTSPVV